MAIQTPSYLLKSRHGIWYFQIQIPRKYRTSDRRQLFRKSLKTTNRLLALKQARIWWLRMVENDFEWEEEAGHQNEKYHRGKLIYQQLDALDSDDAYEVEQFFNSLSESEETALRYYNDSKPDTSKETSGSKENPNPSSAIITSSFLLSELTDKFISEKRINWGEKKRDSTEHKDYRPKISLFIEIIGNVDGSQLVKQHIIKYKEALFNLPANRNKKKEYKEKTISELLGSDIPEEDLLSNTTVHNHFVKIATFLKWMAQNGYCHPSLETPLHGVIKKTKSIDEHRDAFSENNLKSLFNNDYYFSKQHKMASHYWVPLLGLFTGARENELCQLYVSDIKKVDDIWVIDFNEEEDKKLKTLSSKRQVPIHSVLTKELQFLKYIEKLRGNEQRLFPELKHSRDGYGQAFSKWFNRTYRKNVCVGQSNDEQKDFHSFRHTFSNYFKQLGNIDEYRVAELIGHKSETTSITYNRYGKSSPLAQKKKLIQKLKIDFIEFNRFAHWI
jgi:integrase